MILEKIIRKVLGRNSILKHFDRVKEIEWAHVYHDSIRGKHWLENLPLNIGRWSGNYAFFYLLNRILNDYRPSRIVEFGLGESTKFISTYVQNFLTDSQHVVIEQDPDWKAAFCDRFAVSDKTDIRLFSVKEIGVKGFQTYSYNNIENELTGKFDLYIVDGPKKSKHYSRYDIVNLAKSFKAEDEFIIILDDYNRKGEQETFEDLKLVLKSQKIDFVTEIYSGSKDVAVLGTLRYRYITTL